MSDNPTIMLQPHEQMTPADKARLETANRISALIFDVVAQASKDHGDDKLLGPIIAMGLFGALDRIRQVAPTAVHTAIITYVRKNGL